MIAEHRLSQIVNGDWDISFDQASRAADILSSRIQQIHPALHVVEPSDVQAETHNGRVAASTIRQYPPGIPEVIPGMRYSAKTIKLLEDAHANGGEIIGVDMQTDRLVEVLASNKTPQNKFDIQTYDAQSLSGDIANEIADYFRRSFCEAPYFHFAFHESDPLQSLPHTLAFSLYQR